jgi:hypothetical protein
MYALLYNEQATGPDLPLPAPAPDSIHQVSSEDHSDFHCITSTEPRPDGTVDEVSFQIISSMSLPGQTIGVVIDIFIILAPSDTPRIFERRVSQPIKDETDQA